MNVIVVNGSLYNEKFDSKNFRLLCPPFPVPVFRMSFNNNCYLNWAPRGNIMVNKNVTQLRKNEIINSLKSMDKSFGKNYQGHTLPFTMYGPFDNKNNIIFRDGTDSLKTNHELKKHPRFDRNLDLFYESYDPKECVLSSTPELISSTILVSVCLSLIWIF